MGERALTVRERIIVHLSGFGRFADEYECPADMCQSGISAAIGKSRAHVTLELKKMREAGLVAERNAHVKGGRPKRKTYVLTPLGQALFSEINGFLISMRVKVVEGKMSRIMSGLEAVDHLRAEQDMTRAMATGMVFASGGILVQSSGEANRPDRAFLPERPRGFVPRKELDRLRTMLDRERPGTVMLLGMHGMGKTALLSELAWNLAPERKVMYRKLYPYDSAASLIADMGMFMDSSGYPGLRRFLADAGQLDLPEVGCHLSNALDGRRAVLILDGYEQAPESMGPLFSLMAEIARKSDIGLVFGSSRKGRFYNLEDLALDRTVREVQLGPMSDEEACAFLETCEGRSRVDVSAAGGHPLALRLLAAGTGPGTLAEFVEDEILGKDSDLSRLCRFVSVIRKPFRPEDLELMGFDSAAGIRHNLAFEGHPEGGYLLHPAISSMMLAATGKRMLKEMHAKAAEFCRETGYGHAETLYHLVQAGRGNDAMGQMLERGESLLSDGNPEELAAIAESLLHENGTDRKFLLLAANIFNIVGRWDRAKELAVSIAGDAPGTPEAAKAGIIRANILAKTGEPRAALKALEGISGTRLDTQTRTRILYAKASMLKKLGMDSEAMEACGKALAAARKGGDSLLLGQCIMEKSMAVLAAGRAEESRRGLKEAMGLFSAKGSVQDHIRCLINMGMVHRALGADNDAADALESAAEMAGDAGLNRLRAHAMVNLTDLLNRRREYRRALELSAEAADTYSKLGEPLMQAAATLNLSAAHAGLGNRDVAMGAMNEALRILDDMDMAKCRPGWIMECAEVLRGMGEAGKARDILKRYGMDMPRRHGQ